MKIIPVLDLKGGVVVRGVAGRRDQYRPIESRWSADPSVKNVARGLRREFGFDACYVADLDAIGGAPIAGSTPLYDAIRTEGFLLWLDAGVFDLPRLSATVDYFARRDGRGRTIVGLESMPDEGMLDEAVAAGLPVDEIVFSLDLMHGRPLTKIAAWSELSPEKIAERVIAAGIRRLIVLDLAGVGIGEGVPTLELCRRLRAAFPTLKIVSGGGVRTVDDLTAMHDAGCDGALVASALHDGRITPEAMAKWEAGNQKSEW